MMVWDNIVLDGVLPSTILSLSRLLKFYMYKEIR